jgi:hypothetical protein
MALYLLHVKSFSREKGGRITRAAAYRAGERIRDERTREVYSFSDRDDVLHKEIFLPTSCSGNPALDWARDRSTLWNAAERTNRRNALLGREVLVVLPYEVSQAQRTHLVRRFSQDLADRYGCAVDATIHPPRPKADERHHHAHILMTNRQVTPDGLGPRTSLALSSLERHTAGLEPYKADFTWIRERWADVTNDMFKESGLDIRVDHRGARARGLDHEPVPLIPNKIVWMERNSGVPSRAGEEIRRRYKERVEARKNGPDELARVLLKQKEEGRQQALERAQQRAAAPKKLAWSALTKEELAQRRRDRYQMNKEHFERKRREAYQRNPELMRAKKRAARAREREKLSPEQRSVQRWLKWRERHHQPTPPGRNYPERSRPALVAEKVQRRLPAPTAADSVKRWQKWRELHKEPAPPARDREHALPALTPKDSVKRWLAFREAQKAGTAPQLAMENTSSKRQRSYTHDDDLNDRHRRITRRIEYDFER